LLLWNSRPPRFYASEILACIPTKSGFWSALSVLDGDLVQDVCLERLAFLKVNFRLKFGLLLKDVLEGG